jgi:hypothetical protein
VGLLVPWYVWPGPAYDELVRRPQGGGALGGAWRAHAPEHTWRPRRAPSHGRRGAAPARMRRLQERARACGRARAAGPADGPRPRRPRLPRRQIASTADIPAGSKAAIVVGGSAGPGPEKPFSQLHADAWGRLKDAGWALYG